MPAPPLAPSAPRTPVAERAPRSRPASGTSAPRYRKDIDGLRAVAVLLVVVYHVWLDRVSGGVDAFLMISAFFLTGSFIRRLEAGRPLAVVGQWIRTFKRLLPAASVVIAATVVAGSFVLPASGHQDLWRHAWASLFYYENWALAAESVDYYADTSLASPLQHFWSLSVQGQVFFLWPLLFAAIAFIRWALGRRSVRLVALVCFLLLFAASLAYSVITTQAHQESAYFNTGARLWEFAAGSVLAIVLPWISLPRVLSAVIGWGGLVALLACGMVLDVQGGFPGYLALWPVLAVAAIILAGASDERGFGPSVLLETKPVLALGRDAYALYLVHWPILVLTLIARRGEPLGFVGGLVLILVSIALARLLTWLVDARVRRSEWANRSDVRGFLVILLSVALVAVPLTALQHSAAQQARDLADVSQAELLRSNPGAAVLLPDWNGEWDDSAPRIPLPTELDAQWGGLPQNCNSPDLPFLSHNMRDRCSENGFEDPSMTIAVVGNSHPEQWLVPLSEIAEEQGWRLVSPLMGGCEFTLRSADLYADPAFGEECLQWNVELMEFLTEFSPDLVISVGTTAWPTDPDAELDAGEQERFVEGQDQTLEILRQQGIATVLLRDNPRFTFDNYVCVEQAREADECDVQRSQALAAVNPLEAVVGAGVAAVDMTDLICPDDVCKAVIGNVNVYLDDNHLTIAYTATMRAALEERLLAAIAQALSWESAGADPAAEDAQPGEEEAPADESEEPLPDPEFSVV
ncbi:acyltransferase family protein [Leucobacter sp. UCD-THU]|uniref:acyltransferase family protein n=1 Tax=Leucobacter sp. UCD-THU TaxID=1292023 RepID=UPI0003649B4E|nr:acyltransferase family protein [Leucobacter sp. UCD-THU]